MTPVQFEIYTDRMRAMIVHEDTLRDQRLHWLIASQGLLLTALSFAWGKDDVLVILMALMGLVFAVTIGSNLWCGKLAIHKLSEEWELENKTHKCRPHIIALRSREVTPSCVTHLYPWHAVPMALTILWVLILVYAVVW